MSFKEIKPLVSIIVPVYNAEHFIADCLNSIITQTYEAIEVLVSDDCSSDNTRSELKKFANDDRIKIFLQSKNLGITKNCNFLLTQARGKYVCFFAGDDVMMSSKVSKQVRYMEGNPNVSFCYHHFDILMRAKDGTFKPLKVKQQRQLTNVTGIIQQMGVPASMSIMVKKSSLPSYNFDESYKYISDWMMQIDLALVGDIGYINENLCRYRKYDNYNSKDISTYEHEFTYLLNYVAKTHPELSSVCKKAQARYLFGRSFRENDANHRRSSLLGSLNNQYTTLAFTFLMISYLPFSDKFFQLVDSKKIQLRNIYTLIFR